MGWGIGFALDDNNILYCADGCKWKARKSDMPLKPSGCQYVLDYFEGELYSELDMIRDECPGTAAALRDACDENIGIATRAYERLSDEEKAELSKTALESFESDLQLAVDRLKGEKEVYAECKKAFKAYKPPNKTPKFRLDELRMLIRPLELELDMEVTADKIEKLTKSIKSLKRSIKLEKS
ncbi:hypothetical protein EBT25_17380 [bacterium]|jgi:hypothetical protein|nr:hypothetical protein [bacterium]